MRKFILFYLLLAVAGLAFCSCQLFAEDELVEFTLPSWPEYLPELEGWKLALSFDGAQDKLPQGPQVLSPDTRHISLRLPKNQPVCITASPITQNQFFKPAGTIYPYSQKITWSGGYAAYLYKIIPESQQFNWEKFLETMEQKDVAKAEPFYNPWLLDSQDVMEGITYRSFTATKLKLSQVLCVPLDFEVYSSYVPENEFLRQNNQYYVTVKKGQPELFALCAAVSYGVIINASSAKNISLDLISMPIFKEEL